MTTINYAKALVDEGYHSMTVYFSLVVCGALMVEPAESESRDSLDRFIAALAGLAERARAGDAEFFHEAPRHTPRCRLGEAAE